MPTYDFKCPGCGETFEAIVPMSSGGVFKCECGAVATKQFSPNRNIFIPAAFGRSRTWHMSERGPSENSEVSSGSTYHAPRRETFREAFDKNAKKAGIV